MDLRFAAPFRIKAGRRRASRSGAVETSAPARSTAYRAACAAICKHQSLTSSLTRPQADGLAGSRAQLSTRRKHALKGDAKTQGQVRLHIVVRLVAARRREGIIIHVH